MTTIETIIAPCLDAALEYHAMGLPIALAVGKNPGAVMGADWHRRRFTPEEIEQRLRANPDLNVGMILGPASGLIDLECDAPGAEQSYSDLFEGCELPTPPTYLSKRGRHRLFKYPSKLGMISALPKFQNMEKGLAVVKFGELEIRLGIGGKAAQSLLPPSTTDGVTRRWVEGLSIGECAVPSLPDIVVDRIIAAAAKKFEPVERPSNSEGRRPDGRLRPGDDFNARGTWEDAFGDSGWVCVERSGNVLYWRRPGKSDGWSATTGYCSSDCGEDLLYVFSTSAAPLEGGKPYSKFATFAFLHFNGDFSVAASELAVRGYGDPLEDAPDEVLDEETDEETDNASLPRAEVTTDLAQPRNPSRDADIAKIRKAIRHDGLTRVVQRGVSNATFDLVFMHDGGEVFVNIGRAKDVFSFGTVQAAVAERLHHVIKSRTKAGWHPVAAAIFHAAEVVHTSTAEERLSDLLLAFASRTLGRVRQNLKVEDVPVEGSYRTYDWPEAFTTPEGMLYVSLAPFITWANTTFLGERRTAAEVTTELTRLGFDRVDIQRRVAGKKEKRRYWFGKRPDGGGAVMSPAQLRQPHSGNSSVHTAAEEVEPLESY